MYASTVNQSSFPACPSNHSAIGTVNDMLLKLLQYFLRYDTTRTLCCVQGIYRKKIHAIVYVQFRAWYHLNTK